MLRPEALRLALTVPGHRDRAAFAWSDDQGTATYALAFRVRPDGVLKEPTANVSLQGRLQQRPQHWSVALECEKGLREASEAEVEVEVRLRGGDNDDDTVLVVRRRKRCPADERAGAANAGDVSLVPAAPSSRAAPAHRVFLGVVSGALLALVLLAAALAAFHLRRRRKARKQNHAASSTLGRGGDYAPVATQDPEFTYLHGKSLARP